MQRNPPVAFRSHSPLRYRSNGNNKRLIALKSGGANRLSKGTTHEESDNYRGVQDEYWKSPNSRMTQGAVVFARIGFTFVRAPTTPAWLVGMPSLLIPSREI